MAWISSPTPQQPTSPLLQSALVDPLRGCGTSRAFAQAKPRAHARSRGPGWRRSTSWHLEALQAKASRGSDVHDLMALLELVRTKNTGRLSGPGFTGSNWTNVGMMCIGRPDKIWTQSPLVGGLTLPIHTNVACPTCR